MRLAPINLLEWIEENKDSFVPPVSNKVVYEDSEFIFMVVRGPNARSDFHVNPGDEIFYQLRGTIVVDLRHEGTTVPTAVREGELLLVPKGTPHSPHRPAGTWGVVIERQRRRGERDEIVWFCDRCGHELERKRFALRDITTELAELLDAFNRDERARTCRRCRHVLPVAVDYVLPESGA